MAYFYLFFRIMIFFLRKLKNRDGIKDLKTYLIVEKATDQRAVKNIQKKLAIFIAKDSIIKLSSSLEHLISRSGHTSSLHPLQYL